MKPEQFKEIRNKIGLKQQELAELLGLSQEMVIGHYETGFRNPNKLIQVIMSILGALPEKKRAEFMALLRTHAKRIETSHRGGSRG